MIYYPIESKLKCEFLDCAYGMGLAGRGVCVGGGAWWMQCCPEWQDNEEYQEAMRKYYEAESASWEELTIR